MSPRISIRRSASPAPSDQAMRRPRRRGPDLKLSRGKPHQVRGVGEKLG